MLVDPRPNRERLAMCCGGYMSPASGAGLVGWHLMFLLYSLGFRSKPGCGCLPLMKDMNAAGPVGVRERRDYFLQKLRDAYDATTWIERTKATALAVVTGLAFHLNPLDPIPSLLDEAIRRASQPENDSSSCRVRRS